MKRLLILLLIFLTGCLRTKVEQEHMRDPILCEESGHCYVTYVWFRGEIIASWYDDIQTITDSIVLLRRKQGEKILNSLSK